MTAGAPVLTDDSALTGTSAGTWHPVRMAQHVEIHVPLAPGDRSPAWVERVEDFLYELDEEGVIEVFDDAEPWNDVCIFFIAGAGSLA